jgi:hypothetical protein
MQFNPGDKIYRYNNGPGPRAGVIDEAVFVRALPDELTGENRFDIEVQGPDGNLVPALSTRWSGCQDGAVFLMIKHLEDLLVKDEERTDLCQAAVDKAQALLIDARQWQRLHRDNLRLARRRYHELNPGPSGDGT